MHRDLKRLADGRFDLLVIGGGITGAFLALDAVLRGLSVALVDKSDFGAYTSSASSKLLHGGIRYLPKGQFWKVRESHRETAIFQHIAPHMTRWIPFLVPTESGSLMKGRAAMKAAMALYGLCSAGLDRLIDDPGKKAPDRTFLPAEQARAVCPLLTSRQGLTGAQILWESHMFNSERMTLAVIKSAVHRGAEVANYLEVRELLVHRGQVIGARVTDRLGGAGFDIQARVTINAAGPHVQAINDSVPELRLERRLTGFSKGVHLVTRQVEPEYALAMTMAKKTEGFVSRGGRHFFIIPWRGCSLIGTTNVPFTYHLDRVRVKEADITEFLADINAALPEIHLTREDVRYAFCGIYPLIARDIRTDTYQGTGEYQVIDHDRANGIKGIITALGAKYTTARHVAERSLDLAMRKLAQQGSPCLTGTTRLFEGDINDIQEFRSQCHQTYAGDLSPEVLDAMIANHGAAVHELVAEGQKLDLLQPTAVDREVLDIEIRHAVHAEMAVTLDDLIFRRTGLGTIGHPGALAVQRCAELMGGVLNWDDAERQRQIALVEARYRFT